jgi:8-oxo-dGTP pyrophosphatase MutT (NUDIX family)
MSQEPIIPPIRALAIAVIRRGDEILGFDVEDRSKAMTGFRPLGGGIEYGEYSVDAVRREVREELSCELVDPRLLGVLENVFTYMGRQGHEVVFAFEGRLEDDGLYDKEEIEFEEPEAPGLVTALWRPVSTFTEGRMALYPDGLLGLLTEG